MSMLVRIKPLAPRKGYKLRSYTLKSSKYEERCGWYVVEDDVAKVLSSVRNIETDDTSPMAFDVCTKEQAEAIDAAERERVERATAAAPLRNRAHAPTRDEVRSASSRVGVLTTRDLPGRGDEDGDESDLDVADLAATIHKPSSTIPGAPSRPNTAQGRPSRAKK